jgi:DNA (cytosine-5)-methyltransferase 1
MVMKRLPTFASLFSGCGGLDLGFEQAGFRGLAAFDLDEQAIDTHNANLKTPGFVADVATSKIRKEIPGRPDVVIAGPPCQGFSTLGKRRLEDPRNSLILTAARLAVDLRPQVIVLENVSGAVSGAMAPLWGQVEQTIHHAGYRFQTHRVTSAHFGVPQIRRRVVLLAWKSRLSNPHFRSLPAKSLRETLSGVGGLENHEPKELKRGSQEYQIALRIRPHQKLCNVRGGDRAVPTWEIPEVYGKTVASERQVLLAVQRLRRQLRLRDHGDADPVRVKDISEACGRIVDSDVRRLHEKQYLRKVGQRYDLVHVFNGKFRRLAWHENAPAVDTRFGEPRYFLHPDEQRGLSVREAARIQGFPDEFILSGPRAAQFRMVGNAVPPPLARQLAITIRDQLL